MSGPFFLTGDFNDWRPADPRLRFQEQTQPYGRDEWGRTHPGRLRLGSYSLVFEAPAGPAQIKVLEGHGWRRQWSTMAYHDREEEFEAHTFRTRCGLRSGVLVPRGAGMQPHAELQLPGGRMRMDFSPYARTLAVHTELDRAPGPLIAPWREFTLPAGAGLREGQAYSTWICLPYGYAANLDYDYPLCLVFDGRSQLYGEDPRQGRYDVEPRRLPQILDPLVRHGVVPPTILVGVEVPRDTLRPTDRERLGQHDRRAALATPGGPLNAAYKRSIQEELLPALRAALPLEPRPLLCGHSWGADFALDLLADAPQAFRGALAISPARPLPRLERLPPAADLRVGVAYGRGDLGPFFLTDGARSGEVLRRKAIRHLIQLGPNQTHSPGTFAEPLSSALSFALD